MSLREGMVYGCMTPEEQNALGDADARMVPIQQFCQKSWAPKIRYAPFWHSSAYRIAPTPVEPFAVDPIVWQVLDRKWRWITADSSGTFATADRPPEGDSLWFGSPGPALTLSFLAPGLIQRGTCPWQEAIAERPEDTP